LQFHIQPEIIGSTAALHVETRDTLSSISSAENTVCP